MRVNLSNTVFGLIVVAIGAVLLLNNLGVTRIDVHAIVPAESSTNTATMVATVIRSLLST